MKNIIFEVDGILWDTTEVVVKDIRETAAIQKKECAKPMDVIANRLFHDASEERENYY